MLLEKETREVFDKVKKSSNKLQDIIKKIDFKKLKGLKMPMRSTDKVTQP